jgi:effector-binding domain-containing protein
MKFLKKILIGLVIFIALYFIVALFLPGNMYIERSTFIATNSSKAFTEVNNFKTWKNWSYWDNIDSAIQSSYEGPETGVGSKHIWKSTHKNVGNGSMIITSVQENKLIETELQMEDWTPNKGGWKFADSANGTNVSIFINMDIMLPFRPLMLVMGFDKMMNEDFDKTLAGLKKHCESMPRKPEIRVEERNVTAMQVLTIRDTVTNMSEIGARLGELYGEIGAFIGKENLQMAGPVFCIYHTVEDGKMFDMEAGIIVNKKPAKTEGRIKSWETKPGAAIVALHYGPYEETMEAYALLQKWAADNGKKLSGPSWDVYITDPATVKNPYEILTEVWNYVE